MGDTNRKTGLWLEELAVPYYVFSEAGVLITLASPKGGQVPLDPGSESTVATNSTIRRFRKDPVAFSHLSGAAVLATQKAEDFDMVLLTGGHGAIWDFSDNEPLQQLLEEFNRRHKPIGALCHGVAALVSLKDSVGQPLIKGRRLTAFSNKEEQASGLSGIVPYLLESKLVSLGASYSSGADFTSHTVVDGNLVTGQNPASSLELAKQLLALANALPKMTAAIIFN
jgi:putative intracellular protease/amidase